MWGYPMNAYLYKYKGEKNVLEKEIEQTAQVTGSFRETQGLMKVSLRLKMDDGAQLEANYCYIDALKRYYFVDDVKAENNGFFVLELSQDVLMSHKEDIKRMLVEVGESENPNDSNIDCDLMDALTPIRSEQLQNPFLKSGKLYLLTVQGE